MASNIQKNIIVDDNQHFIDAVKMLLKTQTPIKKVGKAINVTHFFEISENSAAYSVLMDINMLVTSSITTRKKSIELNKELKILGDTMSDDLSTHAEMLKTGFSGGILKNQFSKNYSETINIITKGEKYFPILENKKHLDQIK